MAVKATHTQADMVVLSLRIWLQMLHILQQIWLLFLVDMAASATHNPADVVVLWLYYT